MTRGDAEEDRRREPDPDEFDDIDDLPPRRRVDADEKEDYDEWREERRQRGRKRRGPNEKGRHRQRDEDEF